MPGDIDIRGDSRGSAVHKAVAESGKFCSILAYLDQVCESPPNKSRSDRHIPKVSQRIFDVPSSSSISSSEAQQSRPTSSSRRRQRVQQQSAQSNRAGDSNLGRRKEQQGSIRAPWNGSTKKKPPTTRKSGKLTGLSTPSAKKGGGDQTSYVHKPDRTIPLPRRSIGDAMNFDSQRDRHHRDPLVADLSSSDHRLANGVGADNGEDSRREGENFEKVPHRSSSTRPECTTAAAAYEKPRWVWDEWDFDPSSSQDGSNSDWDKCIDNSRNLSSFSIASNITRGQGRHETSYPAAHSTTSIVTTAGRIAAAKRSKVLTRGEDTVPDTCTSVARQAFEDVQATARAMRDDLKERRSQVLELKTNLQRVRASNERRRMKLSKRWAARAQTVLVEKAAAAERQRTFSRQLEKDVDTLDEKLSGLERQVDRFREGRERDCALARSECGRELKKAREAWMAAEKGRLQRLSKKRASAIKQAAVRALEPQLSELVKSNRAEARATAEDLETALLGLQTTLERESAENVQAGAKEYQMPLEAEEDEERRQAEHQLRLLARSNEVETQEFREVTRRDLEGERVRFEAGRKRGREAACKEIEAARTAEAGRAALTLAEHARELRETEESNRQQEEETRRRLAQETGRWQRHVLASARKEAEEKDGVKKREIREKCNEDLDMVIKRLETEANQTREAARAETQREAAAAVESRARELATAQEQETRAMERYLDSARRQAELGSETKGLEQEIKAMEERIREESERLAKAERQQNEGLERWRSRLDQLQGECSSERKSARDELCRLADRSEEAEGTARRATGVAEKESAELRASLSAEFAQVETKVEAVLKRKTEQAEALKKRLSTLQAQTKAREKELSDYRRQTFS